MARHSTQRDPHNKMSKDSEHDLRRRILGRPLVLVVEEEDSIRALLSRVLEADGCEVLTSASAQEAISRVEDRLDAIDLVIADLSLPGIRGSGGLMRRLSRGTKVLLLSIGTDDLESPMARKDVAVLHGPFRPNVLSDRIRKILSDRGSD